MDYVFRIGPVQTSEGDRFIYFIDAGDENSPDPVMAAGDEEALEQIALQRRGYELRCEPRLEPMGSRFGFEGLEPDLMQSHRMGLVAFDMVFGDELDNVEADGALYQFGIACGLLWQAAPWQKSFSEDVLTLELSGIREAVWELALIGDDGDDDDDYGLALYPQVGQMARLQSLVAEGRVEEAARLGSLGVSLKPGPDWAAEVFSTVYDLPRVPHPIKVVDGERDYVDETDLITLAAALQAVAILEEEDPGATGKVAVGDVEVDAHVVVPETG